MIGDHLKLVENVPEGAAFCFDGKSKKQKIDQNDIIRELFDLGMGGSFYAQVVFLSTPSARRATRHRTRVFGPNQISIHALREEGDSKNRDKISIFKQIIQHSARI